MSSSVSLTRRITRSQSFATPSTTVLGKRTASMSRSPSVLSRKSSLMMTPEPTPKSKRLRVDTSVEDPNGNKENIPPTPSSRDGDEDSSTATRLTWAQGIHRIPSYSRDASTPIRQHSHIDIPETPASSIERLSLNTPPPTPTTTSSLVARVRSLIRASSDPSQSMSPNGREKEREIIDSFLRSFELASSSSAVKPVLYISGSPGTGKTALVNSILASTSLISTRVVFLNCMAFGNIDTLWERIGEELFGVISKGSRKTKRTYDKNNVTRLLENEKTMKFMLILDEMDYLSSNISLQPLIHLVVRLSSVIRLMGIANTHTLSSKNSLLPFALESSAEYIHTVHFAPYTSIQLLAILYKRLEPVAEDDELKEDIRKLLPVPALTLLTKKVAAVTGDVRVLFEVLRGAIDASNNTVPKTAESSSSFNPITPAHILSALRSYTPQSSASSSPTKPTGSNSETITKVCGLGLQARLVLLALLIASKRVAQGLTINSTSTSTLNSPTKRPTAKQFQSASTFSFTSPFPSSSFPDSHSPPLDAPALHTFYAALLCTSDTFTPVSRSDFTDLLGVLETTGLVSIGLSSASASRPLKRSSSFKNSKRKVGGAAQTQSVTLQSGMRESEVARGLGITEAAAVIVAAADTHTDVREEAVRSIWEREMGKIRSEMRARADAMEMDVDRATREDDLGFDDAMED